MKIGLFAGAFDPIHLGHTAFIGRAIKENGLDKVYVLVERKPKFKACLASYEDRKEMVRLALTVITKTELHEAASKSFPITASLPGIKKTIPGAQIFLLLGDDVAEHIDKWDNAAGILKGVGLIIARRSGPGEYSNISSVTVRNKIKHHQTPELDSKVLRYIEKNRLY